MLVLAMLLQGTPPPPQRGVADPGVIATNQRITPAGVQSVFDGRVTGLRFGATSQEVWVAVPGSVFRMAWSDNRVLARIPMSGRAGIYALARDPAGDRMLVSSVGRVPAGAPRPPGVAANSGSVAQLSAIARDSLRPFGGFGHDMAGSPAIASRANSSGRRVMVLPLPTDDQLAVLDAGSGALLHSIHLGVVPLAVAIASDGSLAWVTEMAGVPPGGGDRSVRQCCEARSGAIRVDQRGIAEPGSVARVDLATGAIGQRITVGRHPTAIVWDETRGRAFVADGSSDDISVIDTRNGTLAGTIPVSPFRARAIGVAPTALALAPDGATLYVALGGANAVAVYDVAEAPEGARLRGMIPTAWYPTTLDVSPDGRLLAIGTLLGVGSGTSTTSGSPGMTGRYVHAVRGAVNVLEVPSAGRLAAFTTAVSQNNRLPLAGGGPDARPARNVAPRAIPERPGEPSLIHHVVYVIRENRTYDQVLGDLGRGDSDSSLVIYGRDVTPNSHALAKRFVTLDRFFASGGNSADGHQWLTQANETEYTLWPLYEGRSYPYDGTDPLAYSNGGFIWDAAAARNRSVAVFGEFAPEKNDSGALGRVRLLEQYRGRVPGGALRLPAFNITSPIPSLDKVLVRDFPSWTLDIPDVVRSDIFLAHLAEWQQHDSMPNLVIVQLPGNHTQGTSEGWCTPRACVADNDLALGQIVDGLSHSRFWNDMAILVVEDDAQGGVDHVDGHRTVALAISPYTRHGAVDATFYNHPSLLKTIELILGLPALSIFDLAATDLGNSFIGPADHPDASPYTAIVPRQSIYELNPRAESLRGPARSAALASARMRFDIPDAAPSEQLNRILWHDVKGWKVPYPRVRGALFFPMSLDVNDEDRDGDHDKRRPE